MDGREGRKDEPPCQSYGFDIAGVDDVGLEGRKAERKP